MKPRENYNLKEGNVPVRIPGPVTQCKHSSIPGYTKNKYSHLREYQRLSQVHVAGIVLQHSWLYKEQFNHVC